MKHLKTFESFEDNIPVAKFQLEEDQVDDLHEQFESFIEDWQSKNKELSHKEIENIFSDNENGELSDEFVEFLQYLEDNTSWFNFNLMDKVRNDLSIIVAKSGIDYEEDEDDFEFAQDDPEWPHESSEESGEFADPDMGVEDDIEELRQKTFSKEPEMKLDDILDKINDSGYDSLTDEEREFLSKQEGRKILGFGKFNK